MAASRFAYERRLVGRGDVEVTVRVTESMAPEEIELIFEVPAGTPEAWIDASSLTLMSLNGRFE